MKTINKTFGLLFLICCLTISCEENSIKPQSKLQMLTNQVIESIDFVNLNIPLASLKIENSQFISSQENSITIPFDGMDDRKSIIALFNDANDVIAVTYFEVVIDFHPDLIYENLKNGNFTGDFIFRAEDGTVELNVENSTVVSQTISKNAMGRLAEKEPECNDITKPGGAYDCAGARISNLNWFDKTICYATFVGCFGQAVVSCMIDGCEV